MMKGNRLLVLSPHPDDAVWSVGGGVAALQAASDLVLVTLFDGDPAGDSIRRSCTRSERWRRFGDMIVRRDEDAKAATRLGCERLSVGLVDGALRMGADGTFECAAPDALFRAMEPRSGAALLDRLEQRLLELIRPGDRILAPLGVGGHVDHRITREVARRLPGTIDYYADFPYAMLGREDELAGLVGALGLAPQPFRLACDWPAWVEASSCYRSQIIRLFGTNGRFLQALTAYANQDGSAPCCRIWSMPSR